MPDPNCTLIHVASPAASADFYAELLGKPPVEASANFAMFALEGGAMLGLWATHDVQPPASAAGGTEIGFSVDSDDTVSRLHRDWSARDVAILQPPTRMDFGYTFVALDPDGHRLRVFAPSEG